jgi:hypothetical protein
MHMASVGKDKYVKISLHFAKISYILYIRILFLHVPDMSACPEITLLIL